MRKAANPTFINMQTIAKQKSFQPQQQRTHNQAFCLKCQKPVSLVTFQEAANHCGIETREIFRSAELNEIHRVHNSKGEIMICFNSLRVMRFYLRKTDSLDFAELENFHARNRAESLGFTTLKDFERSSDGRAD